MDACIFCNYKNDNRGTIIFENDFCLCIELTHKVLIGSCIIIPKTHKITVFDLTAQEWDATKTLLDMVKIYLDEKYQPDGYTTGWNCGETGGQSIFHAHLHIIPRYHDDDIRINTRQKDYDTDMFEDMAAKIGNQL